MENMQTRILGKIEDAITGADLDAVKRGQWANTGSVFAMNGLMTTLTVRYQFNDTYCTIELYGPSVDYAAEQVDSVTLRPAIEDAPPYPYRLEKKGGKLMLSYHYLEYTEGARLTDMVAMVERLASC